MASRVSSYNAKDCTITVNGVYITGLGEDMITGSKDEEFFSTSVGAQGDVIVNEINNELGTIELTLQATSPQRDYMMKLAKNRTTFSIWVVNKSIKERFGGTKARVKNYPEHSDSKEASDLKFTIQVFDYTDENA